MRRQPPAGSMAHSLADLKEPVLRSATAQGLEQLQRGAVADGAGLAALAEGELGCAIQRLDLLPRKRHSSDTRQQEIAALHHHEVTASGGAGGSSLAMVASTMPRSSSDIGLASLGTTWGTRRHGSRGCHRPPALLVIERPNRL